MFIQKKFHKNPGFLKNKPVLKSYSTNLFRNFSRNLVGHTKVSQKYIMQKGIYLKNGKLKTTFKKTVQCNSINLVLKFN